MLTTVFCLDEILGTLTLDLPILAAIFENAQTRVDYLSLEEVSTPLFLFSLYLMVPANSGLKAYSQSCISLSFVACSRIPLCSVHTANVLGVWRSGKQSTNYLLDFLQGTTFLIRSTLKLRLTRSKVCLSSLYSTLADDRLMTALSTLSLSLRYR